MKILHGTWIPDHSDGFIQSGGFYLWVETTEPKRSRRRTSNIHSWQLHASELTEFLTQQLGIKGTSQRPLEEAIAPNFFLLPTSDQQPLPSLELARYLENELPETFGFEWWQVDCYKATASVKMGSHAYGDVVNVIRLLADLHFIALNQLADVQFGADLLFWYHYTQSFKDVLLKDHYIPALKYRRLSAPKPKGKAKAKVNPFEIYPAWEIVSDKYEATLHAYCDYMPLLAVAGSPSPRKQMAFFDKESLLRHFSEYVLTDLVTHTPTTADFDKRIADTLLHQCLQANPLPDTSEAAFKQYQQWQSWHDKITQTQTATPFYVGFQLKEPPGERDAWFLQFLMISKQDLSLRMSLEDYWRMKPRERTAMQRQFGTEVDKNLLLGLGYAARIYPQLWAGLETEQPIGISLDLAAAFDFLKEFAWVLEDAGYKVIVPSWYTPAGRKRAKLRLKTSTRKASSKTAQGYFSLNALVQYRYELSIGDEPVTEREWQQLVNAKAPLVKFRGQWIELDQDKLQEMLDFWKTQQQQSTEMSILDIMRITASGEEGFDVELDRDEALAEMLDKLHDKTRLEPLPNPPGLQGTLRDYQRRGVSWLSYMESLGLNGCLADDMGLGKTIQVIARLVQERVDAAQVGATLKPTLLIVPTSVMGNWRKEIEKFAPHLRVAQHHGSQRIKDQAAFLTLCDSLDVLITSFTLARSDATVLNGVEWHRVVVDEAQNIKNPKAAQTKAIAKLPARHRLALTGTPVENRLLDLWSIFNFLNPGYLGKEAQFRKVFETPIQRENDAIKSTTLKKLVEPFILRRVKTDQSIINDLPAKVEQTLYCNLTKEQASLYEAVVKDVEQQLTQAEGIQRNGLILSTLMKLKQICNHPRQFLQDGSDFSPDRSHKLGRLSEMVAEALEEGESLLIFTQFTEIGEALEKYLKQTLRCNTYYLHGGTSPKKREQMIAAFQDPETEPSVFVLSLKAGGVGITLTKANHVFHFDRWWNPAVEDQATDRAFRIGQQKNVFVHKFVALGTLEERINQMIEDKKKLAGAIVGADESWLTQLDNDAFKQLIALNRTAILD